MHAGLPRMDPVGRVLGGRYRVVRKIGSGGMGSVYEATQQDLNRKVAIKILHPHLSDDYELVERFRREAQAAAALGHPNIVGVIDFGNDPPDPPFLVMEFLNGQSLRELMDKSGPLPAKRVALILSQALSALGTAHAAGIVHRDIKPDNLFLVPVSARREVTMVLDFGVAKLLKGGEEVTSAGTVIGTLAYMSPEQARARNVDGRADLYSIAAVMYHALTGKLPLEASTHPGMLAAILSHVPKPASELRPDVDPAFCAIIDRGLNKDPDKRFASAEEMEHQISTWVDQFQVSGNIPNSIRAPRSGTVPMPAVQAAQPTIRSSSPSQIPEPASAPRGKTVPLSAIPTIPSQPSPSQQPSAAPTRPEAPSQPPQVPPFSLSPGAYPIGAPPPHFATRPSAAPAPSSSPASTGYPPPTASGAMNTLRSAAPTESGRGSSALVWVLLAIGVVSLIAAGMIGALVVWPKYRDAQTQPAADAGPVAPTSTTTPSASPSATGAPSSGSNAVPAADAGAHSADAGAAHAAAKKTRKARICDKTNMYGMYPAQWVQDKMEERLAKIRACYAAGPWNEKNETWVYYTMHVSPTGDVYKVESWANATLNACVEKSLVGMQLGPPRSDAGLVRTCVSSWEE